MISKTSPEGMRVWTISDGYGVLFARKISDENVFVVRFQHGIVFVNRKKLTEVVQPLEDDGKNDCGWLAPEG